MAGHMHREKPRNRHTQSDTKDSQTALKLTRKLKLPFMSISDPVKRLSFLLRERDAADKNIIPFSNS